MLLFWRVLGEVGSVNYPTVTLYYLFYLIIINQSDVPSVYVCICLCVYWRWGYGWAGDRTPDRWGVWRHCHVVRVVYHVLFMSPYKGGTGSLDSQRMLLLELTLGAGAKVASRVHFVLKSVLLTSQRVFFLLSIFLTDIWLFRRS